MRYRIPCEFQRIQINRAIYVRAHTSRPPRARVRAGAGEKNQEEYNSIDLSHNRTVRGVNWKRTPTYTSNDPCKMENTLFFTRREGGEWDAPCAPINKRDSFRNNSALFFRAPLPPPPSFGVLRSIFAELCRLYRARGALPACRRGRRRDTLRSYVTSARLALTSTPIEAIRRISRGLRASGEAARQTYNAATEINIHRDIRVCTCAMSPISLKSARRMECVVSRLDSSSPRRTCSGAC